MIRCTYVATIALLASVMPAYATGLHIGVYTDSVGTGTCVSIPPLTSRVLYVVGIVDDLPAGISGAEFRIEVTNPNGWMISYTAPAGSTPVGDVLDKLPNDNNDGSGLDIGFRSCRTPINGRVQLGQVTMFNLTGAPTRLLVKRHSSPRNPAYPCPLFVECDAPTFSQVCMTPAPADTCAIGVSKAFSPAGNRTGDGPVFIAEISNTFSKIGPVWRVSVSGDSVNTQNLAVTKTFIPGGGVSAFPLRTLLVGNRIVHVSSGGDGPTGAYIGASVYPVVITTTGSIDQVMEARPGESVSATPAATLLATCTGPCATGPSGIRLFQTEQPGRRIFGAENGDIAVLASASTVTVLRPSSGTPLATLNYTMYGAPVFLDAVERLAFATTEAGVAKVVVVSYQGAIVRKHEFGPDNRLIIEGTGLGRWLRVSARRNRMTPVTCSAVNVETGSVADLSPVADNTRSYFSRNKGFMLSVSNTANASELRYFDVSNPTAPLQLWKRDETTPILEACVSATGERVAFRSLAAGSHSAAGDVFVMSREGTGLAQLTDEVPSIARGLRFVGDRFLFDGTSEVLSPVTVPTTVVRLYDLH